MADSWYTKYLGIPFVHHSSSFEGCDCGGLVLLIMKNELKSLIDMEVTADVFTKDKKHTALFYYTRYFEEVQEHQEFDVFMLKRHGMFNHCGVIIDNSKIIHACEGDQVRLDTKNFSKAELQGYYRLKHEYRA